MRNIWFRFLLVGVLALGLSLFVSACTKQKVMVDETAMTQAKEAEAERLRQLQEEEEAKARALQEAEERRLAELKAKEAIEAFENIDVYFEFDKATLTPEAQLILKDKAAFLLERTDLNIIIEGHCDERGTTEYNLALGDRRANSVKNYLQSLGVAGTRMKTKSYGEEMPVDPGHNEAAWAKNRRVHFVIDY